MSQQRTGPTDGPDFPDLPEATVARLPEYLRALHHLAEDGHDTVSSEGLAAAAGVNSAKLRKDLSHLGRTGTRGDREPAASELDPCHGASLLNKHLFTQIFAAASIQVNLRGA